MKLSIELLYYGLLFVWYDEFVSLTVDIDNFDLVVGFQMLAQLGNVNVH